MMEFARCPPNLNYWNVSWDKWCCHWTLISSEAGWMQEGGNIMSDWLISKQEQPKLYNLMSNLSPTHFKWEMWYHFAFPLYIPFFGSLYTWTNFATPLWDKQVLVCLLLGEINSGIQKVTCPEVTHPDHWRKTYESELAATYSNLV